MKQEGLINLEEGRFGKSWIRNPYFDLWQVYTGLYARLVFEPRLPSVSMYVINHIKIFQKKSLICLFNLLDIGRQVYRFKYFQIKGGEGRGSLPFFFITFSYCFIFFFKDLYQLSFARVSFRKRDLFFFLSCWWWTLFKIYCVRGSKLYF